MKTRPLHDRVIIKRMEPETRSAGGIVIPDTATEKPLEGRVVSVGKGRVMDNGEVKPLSVKEGDRILFGKYSGTELKLDGEELLVLRESDIFAVIDLVGSPASGASVSNLGAKREFSVSVADKLGVPVADIEIELRLDGEPAGTLVPGVRPGPYKIEVEDLEAQIELVVTQNGKALARKRLSGDQSEVRFTLDSVRRVRGFASTARPLARCPDGTVGAPCVTCVVGKRTVRICI